MNNIYFLQIMCDFEKEIHYENVYSKKDIAFQEGIKKLEELFRDEYKSMFGKDEEKKIEVKTICAAKLVCAFCTFTCYGSLFLWKQRGCKAS